MIRVPIRFTRRSPQMERRLHIPKSYPEDRAFVWWTWRVAGFRLLCQTCNFRWHYHQTGDSWLARADPASQVGTIVVWNRRTGEPTRTLTIPQGYAGRL